MNHTTNILRGSALLAALAFVSPAFAATTLKLAYTTPETDPQHAMAVKFKETVEQKSNGEIKVNLFPAGQLGNDQAMIDGTRSGIIDSVIVGLASYSSVVPQAGVMELPFLFANGDEAYAALDGAAGAAVAKLFDTQGLTMLAYPENGFRQITNDRGPIRKPEDLKGLRMRVNYAKALNDMFNLLGANPQQLPVAELYTALETGVVDAQDHPLAITESFKFDEVQDYLTISNHAYSPLGWAMNKAKFDGLTPEQQQVIRDAAVEATKEQRAAKAAGDKEIIEKLKAAGMDVNTDIDTAAFQAAVKPVYDTFVADNGGEILDLVRK